MSHERWRGPWLMTPPSRKTRHLPSEAGEENEKSATEWRAPGEDDA